MLKEFSILKLTLFCEKVNADMFAWGLLTTWHVTMTIQINTFRHSSGLVKTCMWAMYYSAIKYLGISVSI